MTTDQNSDHDNEHIPYSGKLKAKQKREALHKPLADAVFSLVRSETVVNPKSLLRVLAEEYQCYNTTQTRLAHVLRKEGFYPCKKSALAHLWARCGTSEEEAAWIMGINLEKSAIPVPAMPVVPLSPLPHVSPRLNDTEFVTALRLIYPQSRYPIPPHPSTTETRHASIREKLSLPSLEDTAELEKRLRETNQYEDRKMMLTPQEVKILALRMHRDGLRYLKPRDIAEKLGIHIWDVYASTPKICKKLGVSSLGNPAELRRLVADSGIFTENEISS